MEYNELEEYEEYDEYYDEIEENEEEQEISSDEVSIKVTNGQLKFKKVNHSERAEKFKRISDGNMTKYANYALEYFGDRCALSGEKFYNFDEKVEGKKSNLSAEHVIALAIGGHDIVPNIVPAVLQYNVRKNGYYILDWWEKQKDINGKDIYSPYRLLKLVNFMMKSIEGRGLSPRKYHELLMKPNEIDKYLEKIEKEDLEETDNSKRKILSDTETTTTIDEDNKKILTKIPLAEGNIIDQVEDSIKRKEYDEKEMMDTFLIDAVRIIQKEKDIAKEEIQIENGDKITIEEKLEEMLVKAIGEIPFEVNVRNKILKQLEELGIEDNKYTVANMLVKNTDILKNAKNNEENQINLIVSDYINQRITLLEEILTEEQIKIAITYMPNLMYDQIAINRVKFWKQYRSNSVEELLKEKYNSANMLIDVLLVLNINGVNLTKIKFSSKIKNIIENTPNKDEILKKLQEISNKATEEWSIGDKLNTQKCFNMEKFREKLMDCKLELTEFEWNRLIRIESKFEKSERLLEEFVNILVILKKNNIDLTKIKQGNTLEDILKYDVNKEEILKKIAEISQYVSKKGNKWPVGPRLNTIKNRNMDDFKEILIKIFKENNLELTEKEIKFFTEKENGRQKKERLTKEFGEVLLILKQNGVDLTQIKSESKISELLQNISNKEQILEELTEISQDIFEKGDNYSLGEILYNRKKNNNMFIEILKNSNFTELEIKHLTEIENNEHKSERITVEFVQILLTLKQNGIDITQIKQGRNATIINELLGNNPNKKEILRKLQKLSNEVDEKWNIGQKLNWQKYSNMDKFKEVLKKEINNQKIELTKDEKIFLEEKVDKYQESERITEEFIQVLGILKEYGIDLTKIKQSKSCNISKLLENNSSKEEILERLEEISEEINENWSIGARLNKQKSRNIDKLKELLISSGMELTETEIKHITENETPQQKSERITNEFVQMLVVLKQNDVDLASIKHGKHIKDILKDKSDKKEIIEKLQQISEEVAKKGEMWSIGSALFTQKNLKIEEFKEVLIKSGIELTEAELKHLTEKRNQNKIKEIIVEQKNNGELGKNQSIANAFQEVIKNVESKQQNYEVLT